MAKLTIEESAILMRGTAAAARVKKQRDAGTRTDATPTNDEQGAMFLHCGKCLAELKAKAEREGSASPRDYARLSVAWTPVGLQVWCVRHDANVLHVDFEGFQHPANLTAPDEGTQKGRAH
jgi:hypothetical protein